jgi:hypothetical protein
MKGREEKQNKIARECPETCNKKNPKRTKFTVHISIVGKQSHLVHKREFRMCPKPKVFLSKCLGSIHYVQESKL